MSGGQFNVYIDFSDFEQQLKYVWDNDKLFRLRAVYIIYTVK